MAKSKTARKGRPILLDGAGSPRAEKFVDLGVNGGILNACMSGGVTCESLGVDWIDRLFLGVDEPVLPTPAGAASPAPIRAARPVRVLLSLSLSLSLSLQF